MKVVADLHLHSKYSRAVSQQMEPKTMALWAVKKGIDLLGTADWTQPLWLKELEANLEEKGEGIYGLKNTEVDSLSSLRSLDKNSLSLQSHANKINDFPYNSSRDALNSKTKEFLLAPRELSKNTKILSNLSSSRANSNFPREPYFILSTEISSIYSQEGKLHRIHNVVLAPSFAVVRKINEELKKRGCNLLSDGRPIIGLSSINLCELLWSIDKNIMVIPAHCFPPEEVLHTKEGIKKINKIKVNDWVFTHKNRWQKVSQVFSREYKGKIYQIIPDYFRLGVTATEEHPFYAIKTKKHCPSINRNFGICKPICSQIKQGCARKYFTQYKPEWIQAKDLQNGDILLFPRFVKTKDRKFVDLEEYVKNFIRKGKELISSGKFRSHEIPKKTNINKDFCRFVGYYLAEGYTSRDLVSLCFHESEREIIEEIKHFIRTTFRIDYFKEYKRKNYKSIELTFYSKILHEFFSNFFYQNKDKRRANNKCLPNWMLELPPEKQKEILIGWWWGDKGYTTSRLLMNQMKIICLRLGIIPSVGVDTSETHLKRGKHNNFEKRIINSQHDTYQFSNLSFFEDKFKLLSLPIFSKFKTKIRRKRGWINKDYIYLPIRKIIKKNYRGKVYNLEVDNDNSYTLEFALVHNCWTPWFSLYGSKSGFDSIEECFGEFSDRIYAVETGLSSDPAMNWRIKELDSRSIVSFSDAHSPAKMGRELTVFELEELSYKDIFAGLITNCDPVFEIARERVKNSPSANARDAMNTKTLSNLLSSPANKHFSPKSNQFNNIAIQQFSNRILYTIEFHPEEGKYHYTGHRNCGIKQTPEETNKKGTTCPVCGRPLTVGVMHRVEELAKGKTIKIVEKTNEAGLVGYYNESDLRRPPYVMLVPLMEILAESLNTSTASQKVINEYNNLTENLGSEIDILTRITIEEIEKISEARVAEGINKVRKSDIVVDPGFDGVFGTVKIWPSFAKAPESKREQMTLL